MERVYPQEYFTLQESDFKEGLKYGAILIIIGVILGSLIVYLATRR